MPIDSAAAGGQEKDGQEIRALEEVVGIIDQNVWGNESEPPARVARCSPTAFLSAEVRQWNVWTEEQRRSRRFGQPAQSDGGERCSLRAAPRRRLTESGVSRVGTCAS